MHCNISNKMKKIQTTNSTSNQDSKIQKKCQLIDKKYYGKVERIIITVNWYNTPWKYKKYQNCYIFFNDHAQISKLRHT